MASYTLSPIGGAGSQFFDNSGNVLSGGKLYTYAAGTTTPQTTWTTPAGTTANSNPIVFNSAGRPANEIWLSWAYSYKFVLKDSNDVLIATYDNIPGLPQPAIVNDASSISYEPNILVTAGSFVVGQTYMIASLGTTDFTAIGAAYNSTGVIFTASGVGTGTGTAYVSTTVETRLRAYEASGGSDYIGFLQSGTGAITTQTVQDKLRQTVSVKDFGAVGDGVTDDTAAFNAMYASTGGFNVPAGTYYLGSNVTTSDQDGFFNADVDANFTGPGKVLLPDLLLYHTANQIGLNIERKTWSDPYYGSMGAFQFGQCAISGAAGTKVISLYGQGIARANNSNSWGANIAGITEGDNTVAIGLELTALKNHANSITYGLAVFGKGYHLNNNAITISSGSSTNAFIKGISIAAISITDTVFDATGISASIGLDFSGGSYSGAEINFPSFLVGATQPGTVNKIGIRGAATTEAPSVRATGADTNIDLELAPKGTGHVLFGVRQATSDVPITGYIEIKDSFGVVRKLAVIS